MRALTSKPRLFSWLIPTWEAFHKLGSCRPIGMGVGPIPWTAITAYADRIGMNQIEYEEFAFLIESLDAVFLQESQPKDKMSPKGKG